MKFVISSSLLSTRLQNVGRVIVSKNNLPILDCFLFQIKGNQLTVTASDNETTLTSTIDLIESDMDITFAVNAKTIQDAIKEIPEQPLDFHVNETNLEITIEYQNGQYKFMGQFGDEYPIPPADEEETATITLDSNSLLTGINCALFATADDELRPVMNGVFFDIKKQNVTIVASDGHKLACNTFHQTEAAEEGSFILPKKPSLLLKNLLQKESGEVIIRFSTKKALFQSESYAMDCRLIEGRFPNYASVIPANNPNSITINRTALQSALRRVLIFSNAQTALVKIHTDMGKITISCQDVDFSMSAEEALFCDYVGLPMSIGFKGTFLMEMLNNMDAEDIIIKLADASRAGVIIPAEVNEERSSLMLLMPMMLND